MKLTATLVFLLFSCLIITGIAQELPPIQNYGPTIYRAGNQNWSISQSKSKLIYVANNDGLLEFNGAKWTLYPTPNETVMRSVKVIGDRIYSGCYMEFGYWEKTKMGKLKYFSISQELSLSLLEDEEIWNILEVDDWILFQSLHRIYIYNTLDKTARTIESREIMTKVFAVKDEIYFQRMEKGIFQLVNGEAIPRITDEVVKTDEVVNIFPKDSGLLVLTRNKGFFNYVKGNLSPLKSQLDQRSNLSIYSAIKLSNNSFALGTISNGILILNDQLEVTFQINQSNGLLNNTALSLFEDMNNNIWSGLDNGISYINIDSPIRIFEDQKGVLGSIYTSAVHHSNIYLGTNQGLFFKPLGSKSDFRFIEGTRGQVWFLEVIDDQLFCGHHTGTYLVEKEKVQIISEVQGTWNIKKPANSENILIQGNYDGLYVLENKLGNWQLRNKIEGFDNSSRYFEKIGQTIIVNHEYKGLFILEVDESLSSAANIQIDSASKGSNSSLITYKEDVLFASKKGIFKYDPKERAFLKDSLLSTIYDKEDYISGRFVLNSSGEKFWIFSENSLTLVSSGNLSKIPKITTVPLTFSERRNVVEYENIISIDGLNTYLLGTSFGYFIIDLDKLLIDDFIVYIDNISYGINDDHSASGDLIDIHKKGDFASSENNFRMSVYTPEYLKHFSPTYQFQLQGIYDVWSDWTSSSTVFYENLPPGTYSFNVRAKVGETISENIASYAFIIAKPWYRTNSMLTVYMLCIVVLSIFTHHIYKRHYVKQQQKLIEENRKELELTKLQNEREIIDLKNAQLEKDFKNKSNELAASTMSIIKKNELLTQIKEQLSQIDNPSALKPVIRVIDRSLNHNEDWELFKEAFDNVDSEFFKNLKELHPDLSPNDMKLCAYLRLNLSSKEVAQLINISPRSVEVKRYRLRKKLNLDSNENLANYILSI